MARLRELSHTADVGFEATAATPEELFEVAARGLVRALGLEAGPLEAAPPEADGATRATTAAGNAAPAAPAPDDSGTEDVQLSRPDGERLMVEWLRELLAGAMSGRGVPTAEVREVTTSEEGPATLRARVRWRRAAERGPAREIKGVTYHGLAVEPTEDGVWHARVVLDV